MPFSVCVCGGALVGLISRFIHLGQFMNCINVVATRCDPFIFSTGNNVKDHSLCGHQSAEYIIEIGN